MFCGESKPRRHQVKPGKIGFYSDSDTDAPSQMWGRGTLLCVCGGGCRYNTNQILVNSTTGKQRCDIVTEQPKLSLNVFPVSQTDVQ